MKSQSNDGGPAFPRPISEDRRHGDLPDGNEMIPEQPGMSLRQWYAGQALMGYLAAHADPNCVFPRPSIVAEWCVKMADEMIVKLAQ